MSDDATPTPTPDERSNVSSKTTKRRRGIDITARLLGRRSSPTTKPDLGVDVTVPGQGMQIIGSKMPPARASKSKVSPAGSTRHDVDP